MKRIACYIALVMILSGVLAVYSCTDESSMEVGGEGETTTLRLNVPMLEISSRSPGSDKENAIHSLWVLIWNGKEAVHNKKYTGSTLPPDHVITIPGVPVGQVEIYVVANEESIGKTYENLDELTNDIEESTIIEDGIEKHVQKVVFKDEARHYFPLKGVPDFEQSTLGLPMSWLGREEVVKLENGGPQEVTVDLKRMVAKINLTISHDYNEEIVINEIAFGKFFGDRLYLFQPGSQLAIPGDVEYVDKVYKELKISLPPATEKKTLSLYVYPSFAWEDGKPSNYTLGFTTTVGGNKKVYPAKALVQGKDRLTSLLRNHVLDVNVKLSDTNVEFNYNVRDWEDKTVTVPDFK